LHKTCSNSIWFLWVILGRCIWRIRPDYDPDQGFDDEQYYDPDLLPPPESEIDYPVEPVDPSLIDSVYHRQVVRFNGYEEPGTVVVDPKAHFLYYLRGTNNTTEFAFLKVTIADIGLVFLHLAVISTGRCNTCIKSLRGCFKLQ
jgi:lipoprotein-anchoring transpeptidase ErfK/SrfK